MAGQQPTMRTGTPDDPPLRAWWSLTTSILCASAPVATWRPSPLSRWGGAATGAQGIAVCRRLRPDLVVLDVGLPDMSGIDVATALRALPRSPLILMQSGTRDPYIVSGSCSKKRRWPSRTGQPRLQSRSRWPGRL